MPNPWVAANTCLSFVDYLDKILYATQYINCIRKGKFYFALWKQIRNVFFIHIYIYILYIDTKIIMLSTTVFQLRKKKKEAILHVVVYFGLGRFCLSFIINASQMAMVLPEFIIVFLNNKCCKSHMYPHNLVLQN